MVFQPLPALRERHYSKMHHDPTNGSLTKPSIAVRCRSRFCNIDREAKMLLKGQVAIITGASSGIGRAAAVAMAREGARVAVNFCKNQAGAEQAVAEIL